MHNEPHSNDSTGDVIFFTFNEFSIKCIINMYEYYISHVLPWFVSVSRAALISRSATP